ncbi:hypothetical protein BBJ29_001149 [Phytophthora kernoviae]|uniref:PX domain-containing protein n=1 Tax=Phytophthora kernoviae TaxID=325452 RepID=A0A3F2RW99_9STRA|nr:hypothetical protein BBP00_00002837 [Phytophthora kernoviae]RLN70785.1 hypothetical protein BBJ29_001149 [Phytophthora kernoviae]
MKSISAHITSFYHSTFHAYTTEVNVDGHRWRLGLRYSKFHEFYDQLVLKVKDFHAPFPPKGTLFFTPKPEERQKQLEEFLQQVLAYYSTKGCPTDVEDLICDLLKVPHHLRGDSEHDDDNVSTSTESVLSEPVHEPHVNSVEKVAPQEEKKKVIVTPELVIETKPEESIVAAEPGDAGAVPGEESSSEVPVGKEEEVVSKPQESNSPTVEETRSVENSRLPVVHEAVQEDAEAVEISMPAGEVKEVKEAIEDKEPVEKETVMIKDVVYSEDIATEGIATEVAERAEAMAQGPETTLPEERPVVGLVALKTKIVTSKPQAVDTPVEGARPEGEKKLSIRKRVSTSWLAAYLPKSLLGFIRHRCMKKTNLVVLCVAILLPMVLARR